MEYSDGNAIYLGSNTGDPATRQYFALQWANRHGLVAGATGTGKTVTLQCLAEGFSRAGVPVFMADVKGDLSGICSPSNMEDFLVKRAKTIGLENYGPESFPVAFWDLFGEKGHPVRTTVSEIGPLLLGRMLQLNETQEGVLSIVFRIADDDGMLLLDLKDLRALLSEVNTRRAEITVQYGNVSSQSIGAIQRALLRLEDQGGDQFFGEPAINLQDFLAADQRGRGYINILAADRLMQSPTLYASFLLWLLAELFEQMPEAGDSDRPKFVFFFDEAHLLFKDAPSALIEKIEQVVRLIRSKGVGIYFVTQNPQDIPDNVLGQLGNRIQHALRAFTPKQRRFIQAASETYRANPAFSTEEVMTELGVGEALVSTLEAKGTPSVVQRVLIRPPCSMLGEAGHSDRESALSQDRVGKRYDKAVDRHSAYESLQEKAKRAADAAEKIKPEDREADERTYSPPKPKRRTTKRAPKRSNRQSIGEAAIKSIVRAVSSSIGRSIAREVIRGVLGSFRR